MSVVVIVFLLYAGNPSDLYRALAAVVGLALGVVLRGEQASLRWQRSTHHETRVLLSSVVAITAIGPAIAIFTTLRLGPLAPLGLLLSDARPTGLSSVDECHATDITRMCLHDMTVERISGAGPVLVTVLPILTLLVAAFGLAGGRRFAAWLAVVVNVALAGLAAWFYGFLPFGGGRSSREPIPDCRGCSRTRPGCQAYEETSRGRRCARLQARFWPPYPGRGA